MVQMAEAMYKEG